MQRYFVEKDAIKLPYIFITGDDCHHIGLVMRMKSGDKVYVSDQEKSYIAVITDIKKDLVTLEVIEELHEQKELPYQVTIAQGLVRREKMEEVIDYITELGASCYIPVVMSRSIVKVNQEQMDKKNARYAKIAKEAALYVMEAISKKSVWFMISEFSGKYYITMFYDNEYNRANGEDL